MIFCAFIFAWQVLGELGQALWRLILCVRVRVHCVCVCDMLLCVPPRNSLCKSSDRHRQTENTRVLLLLRRAPHNKMMMSTACVNAIRPHHVPARIISISIHGAPGPASIRIDWHCLCYVLFRSVMLLGCASSIHQHLSAPSINSAQWLGGVPLCDARCHVRQRRRRRRRRQC